MEIPTNTKNTTKPYKQDVYDAYVTWKSIPACMRLKTAKKVARELTQDDALFGELLQVRNQSEFAERYNIENSTLSNWNKLIEKNEPFSEIRKWGHKLTKNLLWSLYTHTIENGNPKNVELWFQIVEGWSSKKGKRVPEERQYSPVKFTITTKSPVAKAMEETLERNTVS